MEISEVFNSLLSSPITKLFLLWGGLGLAVGVSAKIMIPGSEGIGWIRTIGTGLAGSFLGNYMAPKLLDWPTYAPFSLAGFGIGIAGAIVLVVVNRIVTKTQSLIQFFLISDFDVAELKQLDSK